MAHAHRLEPLALQQPLPAIVLVDHEELLAWSNHAEEGLQLGCSVDLGAVLGTLNPHAELGLDLEDGGLSSAVVLPGEMAADVALNDDCQHANVLYPELLELDLGRLADENLGSAQLPVIG